MKLVQIGMIRFHDREADDEALAIVRGGEGVVTLALSLRGNGDLDVVLGPSEATQLRDLLEQAVAVAERRE